jgi:hypothetical protein
MVSESCVAVGEQGVQEGTEHAPLRGPVLRFRMGDVLLQPIRKSGIQLQKEVFSPRVLSLVMSFEDSMVLNTEL